MHLRRGFSLASKFLPLVIMAVIIDLLQITDIMQRAEDFHVSFAVPSAIPSITQILSDSSHAADGIPLNAPFAYLGGAFLLLFIIFLVLSSFLKGGFLGSVLDGLQGRSFSIDSFMRNARYFFTRFLFQGILIIIVMLILIPVILTLGPLGFVFLILLFLLFILLIFWDYIIVVEDALLLNAARESINLVFSNLGRVIAFIIPIVIFFAFFSIIANFFVAMSVFHVVLAIVIYAYLGTVAIFAVMSFYMEIAE